MTQNASLPPVSEANAATQCKHHWVIQPAMGPMSQGVCQYCGAVKEFQNYVESATWGDSRLAGRSGVEANETVSRVVSGHFDRDEEE